MIKSGGEVNENDVCECGHTWTVHGPSGHCHFAHRDSSQFCYCQQFKPKKKGGQSVRATDDEMIDGLMLENQSLTVQLAVCVEVLKGIKIDSAAWGSHCTIALTNLPALVQEHLAKMGRQEKCEKFVKWLIDENPKCLQLMKDLLHPTSTKKD